MSFAMISGRLRECNIKFRVYRTIVIHTARARICRLAHDPPYYSGDFLKFKDVFFDNFFPTFVLIQTDLFGINNLDLDLFESIRMVSVSV